MKVSYHRKEAKKIIQRRGMVRNPTRLMAFDLDRSVTLTQLD
jgi:hypothetical protein